MKKKLLIIAMLSAGLPLAGCQSTGVDIGGMATAGASLAKAATLSDEDVKALGLKTSALEDSQHTALDASSKQGKRLAALTKGWTDVDGMKINFKAYQSSEINAFAVPDGSVRVYSGLMDNFSDDELRYVLAHEIGHIMSGHSKKALQTAYTTAAAREAAAASGNQAVSALSASQLGAIGEALVNAQFSQAQENEADDYAVDFLKKRGLNPKGSVTALRKLEKMYGNERSVFSSHPSPGERAKRMEERVSAR
ncbi:MAG: M48 family metalloprotease [Halothiobacillaceae bacterium]|nr:M48 family metalloprotease [Halothiobacillaceae bacterium]